MERFRRRWIELAMAHAGSRGHALEFTGSEDGPVAHAVFVFKSAIKDVGDNFHIAVTVHSEAHAGINTIVVDDAERSESHLGGIIVIAERKRMVRVEPAMIKMAALIRSSNLEYGDLRLFCRQRKLDAPGLLLDSVESALVALPAGFTSP